MDSIIIKQKKMEKEIFSIENFIVNMLPKTQIKEHSDQEEIIGQKQKKTLGQDKRASAEDMETQIKEHNDQEEIIGQKQKKRRNNQNSSRTLSRKILKEQSLISSKKPYKIHKSHLGDRRLILTLLRKAHRDGILGQIQSRLYKIYSQLIISLKENQIKSQDKLYKEVCLAQLIIQFDYDMISQEHLEQTLEKLFTCGQDKKMKPNKNWSVEEFLKFEQFIHEKHFS